MELGRKKELWRRLDKSVVEMRRRVWGRRKKLGKKGVRRKLGKRKGGVSRSTFSQRHENRCGKVMMNTFPHIRKMISLSRPLT